MERWCGKYQSRISSSRKYRCKCNQNSGLWYCSGKSRIRCLDVRRRYKRCSTAWYVWNHTWGWYSESRIYCECFRRRWRRYNYTKRSDNCHRRKWCYIQDHTRQDTQGGRRSGRWRICRRCYILYIKRCEERCDNRCKICTGILYGRKSFQLPDRS